jgi:hypothetical protein
MIHDINFLFVSLTNIIKQILLRFSALFLKNDFCFYPKFFRLTTKLTHWYLPVTYRTYWYTFLTNMKIQFTIMNNVLSLIWVCPFGDEILVDADLRQRLQAKNQNNSGLRLSVNSFI